MRLAKRHHRISGLGIALILLVLLTALSIIPLIAQESAVYAEALGQANLRAAADINADKTGEIVFGTRYPVVGRSELYPWLLLGDPVKQYPIGWVYSDLVSITGDVILVPISTMTVTGVTPTSTAVPIGEQSATQALASPTVAPTVTPSSRVMGEALGEINIRYGPGIEYPRIGIAAAGDRFEVTAWHTQFPWVRITYPQAPNGFGWIATDLLTITGDVFSLPGISQTRFDLPTLTPTPAVIQTSVLPGATSVPISASFQALGNQLWNMVLAAGFEPETSKTGALFLLDLQTGEAITFGSQIAFSGTSINKIAILADLYSLLEAPPSADLALDIANTMICSENTATNRLLSIVGSNDEYNGADNVTEFLRKLGLSHTFITAPYVVDPNNIPEPPRPIEYPETGIDQIHANPDPSNQLTVDEMGWLLADIYQCAYQDGGPLMDTFPGAFTAQECRQMLHVMSNNTVDALLKTGVPADTRVAHKHGWIPDTHGNAAVFFTPGGDYVMVMMLFQPSWLDFQESLPLMSEVSRTVYNYFNPDAPMREIRQGYIPEAAACNFSGSPLIGELMSSTFDQ
jgi:hypothetical protein